MLVGFEYFLNRRLELRVVMCYQLKDKRECGLRDYDREVRAFLFRVQVSRLLSAEYYTVLCQVCLFSQLVKRDKKLSNPAGFIMPPL